MWISLTCTENAVEVYFDATHQPVQKIRPGENVSSVGHMRGWTAAGQDSNLLVDQGTRSYKNAKNIYIFYQVKVVSSSD